MNDYYQRAGALHAAEERSQIMAQQMESMRKEMEKMRLDYDAAVLRTKLQLIDRYDEQVQLIIGAHPHLSEAWDNFRVLYQLSANKELLETAKEKILGIAEGICHGCKRNFPGDDQKERTAAKRNEHTVRALRKRVEQLEAELETK